MKSFEIEREIANSEGYQFVQRIRQFSVSTSIFGKNFLEFKKHVEAEIEPEYFFKLQHRQFAQQREDGQLETVRLMHNFLASAFSLVEHTRNYYKKHYDNESAKFPEYQPEVDKRFANNPLANFVKCFRQYMQHFQPSFISYQSNLTESPEGLKAKIILTNDNIMLFKGWNSKAKQYIEGLNGDLNILVMIDDYHTLVAEFYQWFIKRQGEIHKEEVSTLLKMERNLKEQKLREMISHFTTSKTFNNEAFLNAVRDMYNQESKRKFDNLSYQKQLEEMIFSLKANGFINKFQEKEIRERFEV